MGDGAERQWGAAGRATAWQCLLMPRHPAALRLVCADPISSLLPAGGSEGKAYTKIGSDGNAHDQGVLRLPSEGGQQQTFTAELRVDGRSAALGTVQVAELHKVRARVVWGVHEGGVESGSGGAWRSACSHLACLLTPPAAAAAPSLLPPPDCQPG